MSCTRAVCEAVALREMQESIILVRGLGTGEARRWADDHSSRECQTKDWKSHKCVPSLVTEGRDTDVWSTDRFVGKRDQNHAVRVLRCLLLFDD